MYNEFLDIVDTTFIKLYFIYLKKKISRFIMVFKTYVSKNYNIMKKSFYNVGN